MGQSLWKPRPEDMRVGKPELYAFGKVFDVWDFIFNGFAEHSILFFLPCWEQRDNHQQRWWRFQHTNSSLQHWCTPTRRSFRREHGKWWEKLVTTVSKFTDNCFWSTELPIREGVRNVSCESWHSSSVPRWGERYRSRSRPSEKCEHHFDHARSSRRHIFSWMLVNWEISTHDAWRLRITWGAVASSRWFQLETHVDSMEVDAICWTGKVKEKLAGARRLERKEKKAIQANVAENRQQNTQANANVETVRSVNTKFWLFVQAEDQISR